MSTALPNGCSMPLTIASAACSVPLTRPGETNRVLPAAFGCCLY